jgi:uncharacterized membrane protein YfcA
MSATSKRRRRRSTQPATGEPQAVGSTVQQLPEWRWRTFPVFFALAAGTFIGMQLGIVVSAANSTVSLVVFIFVAVLLGLALSRVTTRWLIERRWIKPRPKRRK